MMKKYMYSQDNNGTTNFRCKGSALHFSFLERFGVLRLRLRLRLPQDSRLPTG